MRCHPPFLTATLTWARLPTHGSTPEPRIGHTINFSGALMYVFAGAVDGIATNEVYTLNVGTCTHRRYCARVCELALMHSCPNKLLINRHHEMGKASGNGLCATTTDRPYHGKRRDEWAVSVCLRWCRPSPRGGHGRFELTFSYLWGPSDSLNLHFPML